MWLLDVNMPKKVGSILGELGIEAHSADDKGWGSLTNGALVKAAIQAGFLCILTRDRLFSESAARTLKRFPEFCAVLITISQVRTRVSGGVQRRMGPQPNSSRCWAVVALARGLIEATPHA